MTYVTLPFAFGTLSILHHICSYTNLECNFSVALIKPGAYFFVNPIFNVHCSVLVFFLISADADYKMCGSRGRSSRKDLPTDLLHNQQVSV